MNNFFFFLFISLKIFSQKSEILVNKYLKHNYPIGNVYIIEKETDINKLLFAGEISIVTGKKSLTVKNALQRLEFKCKEVNANSYKLKSFQIIDTTLSMIFNAYFINEVQAKEMKSHKITKHLFVFHNSFDTIIRRIMINESSIILYPDSIVNVNFPYKRKIILKTSNVSEQLIEKKLKSNNEACFISLGFKKNYFSGGIPYTIWYLNNKYNLHTFETFYNLDYNTGRLLIDIYPTMKQISIP